ncbi:MAG TPA: FAD-dependent monooxygenase [Burkholderiaceae bacterium]|jgi:2-polyprenyl-6-methoxyphenol hydroxylase-like FAD-dependent oxidoreductase|nr:FAD-dependent monooxygenase [Burkholderiaceae bacterium]
MSKIDVRIHGSGIVGRALALKLARQGLSVGVDARPAAPAGGEQRADVRAYALNAASVELLSELKVWDGMAPDARTPVYDMRIAGDGQGALAFSAWQQTVPALAWIVDAAELEQVLETAIRFAPAVHVVDADAKAALAVVAEGKAAAARDRLGVRFERHSYGHSALAARVVSDVAHAGVARQWFRAPDVLALLPFDRPQPECSYGVVWSMPQAEAEHLVQASDTDFDDALAAATGGAAGKLQVKGPRATWPLMQASAAEVVGSGWALVGDAAHVIHPLAGQGLNLGLGDVAALAKVIAERESWRALGDEALLRRYARARLWPTRAMAGAVDGLWQLFCAPAPGLRELRNHGMTLVDQLAPLKRFLVSRALGS